MKKITFITEDASKDVISYTTCIMPFEYEGNYYEAHSEYDGDNPGVKVYKELLEESVDFTVEQLLEIEQSMDIWMEENRYEHPRW